MVVAVGLSLSSDVSIVNVQRLVSISSLSHLALEPGV